MALILAGAARESTAAAVAQPDPFATVTTNYYVFGGTNDVQMRAAMIEARPWKQGMVYDAHTKWDLFNTYRYSRTNGQFKLYSADVKARVSVTLPMWVPGKPVSPKLVAKWQKCFTGLSVHEQGHVQLALAAGAEVRRKLNELAAFGSVQELRAAADQALNDTVEEFHQRERRYDQVTGHGRTQGAVFPIEVHEDEDFMAAAGATNNSPRHQNMRRR